MHERDDESADAELGYQPERPRSPPHAGAYLQNAPRVVGLGVGERFGNVGIGVRSLVWFSLIRNLLPSVSTAMAAVLTRPLRQDAPKMAMACRDSGNEDALTQVSTQEHETSLISVGPVELTYYKQ